MRYVVTILLSPRVAQLLLDKAALYNRPAFVERDPLSIPRQFTKRQDVEIVGLWTAVLAWGGRAVILRNAQQLVELMDGAPHDFVVGHTARDLKRFEDFKHRTFNGVDAVCFVKFLRHHYAAHDSLESAFCMQVARGAQTIEPGLVAFAERFAGSPHYLARTRKHVSSPARGSACKRLCMFLRWMVRRDAQGVDMGLWTSISPSQLVMPLDVHVVRVSRALGLMQGDKVNWQSALALTAVLRELDAEDPVRFDFALFGLGVEGEM